MFGDLFSIKKYWRELEMTYIHILNKIKNFSELDQIKAMAPFEYIIVIPNWLLDHINSITCKYLSFQNYNLNY